MKLRRNVGIAVAIILIGWIVVYSSIHREPRYQGRQLSEWVKDAQAVYSQGADPDHPERSPAWLASKDAVNRMGPSAIAFLFEDLVAKASNLKPEIAASAKQKAIAPVLKRKWIQQLQQTVTDDIVKIHERHVRAVDGFALLGSNAKSAEPALIELTEDNDRDKRFWGFVAFAVTKPTKDVFVPVVMRLLKDRDSNIRDTAAQCLQNLYPEEAEKAGVYDLFPDLRPGQTNRVFQHQG